MKKYFFTLLLFSTILLGGMSWIANAAPITPVTGGGTQTSTQPAVGYLLIGNGSTYDFVASSTLKGSGSSGVATTTINNLTNASFTFLGSGIVSISTTSPNTITITAAGGSGVATTTINGALAQFNFATSTVAGVWTISTSSNNGSSTILFIIPPKSDQYFSPSTTIATNNNQLTNGFNFTSLGTSTPLTGLAYFVNGNTLSGTSSFVTSFGNLTGTIALNASSGLLFSTSSNIFSIGLNTSTILLGYVTSSALTAGGTARGNPITIATSTSGNIFNWNCTGTTCTETIPTNILTTTTAIVSGGTATGNNFTLATSTSGTTFNENCTGSTCTLTLPVGLVSTTTQITAGGTATGNVFTLATTTASGAFNINCTSSTCTLKIPSNLGFFTNDVGFVTSSATGVATTTINNVIGNTFTFVTSSALDITTSTGQLKFIFNNPGFVTAASSVTWTAPQIFNVTSTFVGNVSTTFANTLIWANSSGIFVSTGTPSGSGFSDAATSTSGTTFNITTTTTKFTLTIPTNLINTTTQIIAGGTATGNSFTIATSTGNSAVNCTGSTCTFTSPSVSGTTNNLALFTGSNSVGNSQLAQAAGGITDNGSQIIDGGGNWSANVVQSGVANVVQAVSLVWGGGLGNVSIFSSSTTLSSSTVCGTNFGVAQNTTSAITLTFPSLAAVLQTPCNSKFPTQSFTMFQNISTNTVSFVAGASETITYAPGTPSVMPAGVIYTQDGGYTTSTTGDPTFQFRFTLFSSSTINNALILSNANGGYTAYGGASACAAGSAVTTISAVGGTTCATFGTGNGTVTTSSAVTANYFSFWNATNGSGLNGTSSLYRASANDITVGSTSDNGLFSIVNASNTVVLKVASTTIVTSSAVLFDVQSTSSIFQVLASGHINATGTQPTMGTCGSSPSVSGTDMWGTITVGSGVVTSCIMNFAIPYESSAYHCLTTDNSATISAGVTSQTTSSITVGTSATLGGGKIFYSCGLDGL